MTAKAWLPLVLGLCGCAGLGLAPRPAKLGGVTMARETFIAPEAVLRVRWSRPLVLSQAFFAYNPQEFATAALSPDGQTVFVGSSAKVLYALRQRDGEVLWRHQLTGGLASEPLYVPAGEATNEPLLLVGDDDGMLTALSLQTLRYSKLGLATVARRQQSARLWREATNALAQGDVERMVALTRQRIEESGEEAIRRLDTSPTDGDAA